LPSSQPRFGAKIMTENESFADRIRDHATDDDSSRAHQAPERRRSTDVLMHRWPTALGVAVAALTAFDLEIDAGSVSSLSALVVLMALVYIGAAALDRRRASWVVFLAGFAVLVVLPLFDSGADPSVVLLVVALVLVVVGAVRGQLRSPGGLTLQVAGMLSFGVVAMIALYVDPRVGGYLVAFALVGHAAWDAYYFLRDRVVARSYAEFCGVLDLLVGAAILVMA
jgi:hypothetical protein